MQNFSLIGEIFRGTMPGAKSNLRNESDWSKKNKNSLGLSWFRGGGESWRFLDRHLAKGRVSLLFLWTIIQKPIQNHTQLKFCIFASIVISSTFPWNQDSPRKVVYFFDQSDSFLRLDFAPRIVPRNISSTKQKENFYDHIVHLLSKFPLCYFIRGFMLILR